MVRKIGWLIAGVIMLLGLSTCSKKSTNGGGGGTLPTTYTTYSASVQPIWNAKCGTIGTCHINSVIPGGGLNLTSGSSRGNLVNQLSRDFPPLVRVVPNNVDSSYLIDKIEGTQFIVGGGGNQMPQSPGTPLGASQLNVIKAWINAGAPNN